MNLNTIQIFNRRRLCKQFRMGSGQRTSDVIRHKCAACFKQFNKMEYLVQHMKSSFHSEHEPICGICHKHFRSLDSLREHLIGPLPKVDCAGKFSETGCDVCLNVFTSRRELIAHQTTCRLEPALPHSNFRPVGAELTCQDKGLAELAFGGPICLPNKRIQAEERACPSLQINSTIRCGELPAISAVSLDCEMVGGGEGGSLDLCARVCLVGEDERLLFHTYVKPQLPVTDYRYDITGIKPEHLRGAMPLNKVQERIRAFLYGGEKGLPVRPKGRRARIIVGHGLEHDFHCLAMEYPRHLIRDTAKYPPLLKTSKCSNSLKYLAEAYLGYAIQNGAHDPYEDCVAAMRLYKRMRSRVYSCAGGSQRATGRTECWKHRDLEKVMNPDAWLQISRCDYYCWCLDATALPR